MKWRRHKRSLVGSVLLATAVVIACIPHFRGDLTNYGAGLRILDGHGRTLRVTLGPNDRACEPITLNEAGRWTVDALVATEDKRFFNHHGVDPLAVVRAMGQDLWSHRKVSGASTISTLVVKLVSPRPRTFWTKLVEACQARELEQRLTKNQILEQYLNRAPFGGNLYGIEAASQFYFGRSAKDLSLAETALLVGLPQSPSAFRPDIHPDRAIRRRNAVLERMRVCGYITEAQLCHARNQVIAVCKTPRPFLAPHFCDWVLSQTTASTSGVIRTTLDLDLQKQAEDALRNRVSELNAAGVHGGAMVILDAKTHAIRAMVGSPDYFNKANDGQVNAAAALRSPGSALKPFVYALALDQGMCTPDTVVADVPTQFAGYKPVNFDRAFAGPVSIRQALVQSLNIPALVLTDQCGLDRCVGLFRELGLSSINHAPLHYGLGVVIGSCEVRLIELANSYACLADHGVAMPLRYEVGRVVPDEPHIFSAEATYLVSDILSGDERTQDVCGHVADAILPKVAWKTGTSSGQRDAWAIAYNPEYVVGVWLGNPDSQRSDALVGSSAAAPLAYDMFRRLYAGRSSPWFERPAGLATRAVCARSGNMPTEHCSVRITTDYIKGITRSEVCSTCGATVAKAIEAPTPTCSVKITQPVNRQVFHVTDALQRQNQQVKLQASTDANTALYWFIDDTLLAQTRSERSVFWPLIQGHHTIRCSDAQGAHDHVDIVVE